MSAASMSPVFLAPGGRRVAVFGGGAVALRKCRHFRGFRIRVIAPSILPEQRVELTTVSRLAETIAERKLEAPGIMVIGTVAEIRNVLGDMA